MVAVLDHVHLLILIGTNLIEVLTEILAMTTTAKGRMDLVAEAHHHPSKQALIDMSLVMSHLQLQPIRYQIQ